MNSVKCLQCGLINWATATHCRRCNAGFTEPSRPPQRQQAPYAPKPDVSLSHPTPQMGTNPQAPFHPSAPPIAPPPPTNASPTNPYAPRPVRSPYAPGAAPLANNPLAQYLKIAAAVLIAGIVIYVRFQSITPSSPDSEPPPGYSPVKYLKFSAQDPYSPATLRENLMTYIRHPRLLYAEFGGQALAQKLFKEAWVEEYDQDEKEVYFGLEKDKVTTGSLQMYISDFVVDTLRVDVAKDEGKAIRLGDYTADRAKFHSAYFFKMPLDNLKFDIEQVLDFGSYQISLREMADFMSLQSVYGGTLEVHSPGKKTLASILLANHGAFVAKPKEPSLQRFVATYFNNLPRAKTYTREDRVQSLLDYVTKHIQYDSKEASSQKEWLKRPNETLISRRGDCSNKTILFASLLEQIDEDYLLIYLPGHISVAVRRGQFPTRNGLNFRWQGDEWVVAETTVFDFHIGGEVIENSELFKQIEYLQRPSQPGVLYNFATGQQFLF